MERYVEFYDFAPVGYFTLARDSAISEMNFAGASLIGLDRSKLAGRQFINFVAIGNQPDFAAFLARVFESKIKQECDTVLQEKNRLSPDFCACQSNFHQIRRELQFGGVRHHRARVDAEGLA